ncbi:MAG: hypothetical protein JHC98_10030 [Thermoleophilaceae bacterium]|nr:hypothetical protein [Thermoleophilaceae bacterium]
MRGSVVGLVVGFGTAAVFVVLPTVVAIVCFVFGAAQGTVEAFDEYALKWCFIALPILCGVAALTAYQRVGHGASAALAVAIALLIYVPTCMFALATLSLLFDGLDSYAVPLGD